MVHAAESVGPEKREDSTCYVQQSWVTEPGRYAHLYAGLPDDLAGLTCAIQGLLIHYTGGTEIPEDRLREIDTRRVEAMLARIVELDNHPLTMARATEARLVGCCRDYATLFCSVLRHRGVPARLRFGFATYFRSDFLCDHVVAEYWNEHEQRWILVDAELPAEEGKNHAVPFDPLDLPRDRFLLAGDAWQRCRRGDLDPNRCGVNEEICGLSFVAGYVCHDLAALDKQEMLCWDSWGMTDIPPGGTLDTEEIAVIDALAAATLDGTIAGFAGDSRLNPQGEIHSYSAAGFYSLTIP